MLPAHIDRRIAFVAAASLLIAGAAALADYQEGMRQTAQKAELLTGGSVARGKQAFARYGCGGCHSVGGVAQATGQVGPPLTGVASRAIIGGRLENRPPNLMLWISDPQRVSPGTAMPRLGVTPQDSRDIAAFLYTQT
jgi:cytochrome c